MHTHWPRGMMTAFALAALALAGAGCYYDEHDDSGTRISIHVNLLPDDGEDGGVTIRFGTGL